MKFVQILVAATIVLVLVSCKGGGGSDGGSDSSTSTTSTTSSSTTFTNNSDTTDTSDTEADRVFSGIATVVLNADGFETISDTEAITVVISGISVSISAGGNVASGTLNPDGSSFAIPVTVSASEGGISCSGEVVFVGTISGDMVSGTISGTVPCTVLGVSIAVTVSGVFSASM